MTDRLTVSTIRRRCAAIARLHSSEGHVSPTKDPTVSTVLRGIARTNTVAPTKKLVMTPEIVSVSCADPETSLRDKAVLLFGICSAMRRSEIAAICWGEIKPNAAGIEVRVLKSKADQEGRGRTIGLLRLPKKFRELCPVHVLELWRREVPSGPKDKVFPISDRTIAEIAKRAAARAGHDPSLYGGHSFRSGFATNAANEGVAMELWMKHTRHRTTAAAVPYAQVADAMANPAAQAMAASLQRTAAKKGRRR